MEFSDNRLEQLHVTLLEILDYVRKICEENQLSYLLVGGTALGAYRHKGFIPWDDDLDIGLPREDYEKFLDIVRKDKNPVFSAQDEREEEKYFLPFAKIRKNNTVFRETMSPNIYNNVGIYVDIFPIDYVQDANTVRFKIRAYMINLISHALRFKYCRKYYKDNRSKIRYFYDWLISAPFLWCSNKRLLAVQRKLMKKDNNKADNRYAINYASTYNWKKEIMSYDILSPLKEIEFEGRTCYSYAKMEKYLSQVYGNYMELPPEDKRHTHEPLELKF
jgi:lipopolysaccharide cholinephosphotransferase